MIESDYIIIGAGIIGLTLARELKNKVPEASIIILEKEEDVAMHSSGRNSGVLHSGFYYTSDSLKAKFTREGNEAMQAYCKEYNLHINNCKKIVIARNEEEVKTLFELEKRGKANGVDVKIITAKEAEEIEPNVVSYQYALYSPNTATIDPLEICKCMKNELISKGVRFYFKEAYRKRLDGNTIITSVGNQFHAKKIINAAGLYADKVAKDFGFSKKYTIIPFKGIYLKYTAKDKPVKVNIYPVPDLRNPFLGMHYTIAVDNTIKIGPTSIPAFWRENYKGLANFKLGELITILFWDAILFVLNSFGFRNLAFEEVKKYAKKYFYNMAGHMVKEIKAEHFNTWTKPGMRAQLLNKQTRELLMDFVIEGDDASVHVLNAVSPAFTASIPFTKWVVENYIIK